MAIKKKSLKVKKSSRVNENNVSSKVSVKKNGFFDNEYNVLAAALLALVVLALFANFVGSGISGAAVGEVFDLGLLSATVSNFLQNYQNNHLFIDSIITFALFITIFQAAFHGAGKKGFLGENGRLRGTLATLLAAIATGGLLVLFEQKGIKILDYVPGAVMFILVIVFTGILIYMANSWLPKRYMWGGIGLVLLMSLTLLGHLVERFLPAIISEYKFIFGVFGLLYIACVFAVVVTLWTIGKDIILGVKQPITQEQLDQMRQRGLSEAQYRRLQSLMDAEKDASKQERKLRQQARGGIRKIKEAEAIVANVQAELVKQKAGTSWAVLRPLMGGIVNQINALRTVQTAVSGYIGIMKNTQARIEEIIGNVDVENTMGKALFDEAGALANNMEYRYEDIENRLKELNYLAHKKKWEDDDWNNLRILMTELAKNYKSLLTTALGLEAKEQKIRTALLSTGQATVTTLERNLAAGRQ